MSKLKNPTPKTNWKAGDACALSDPKTGHITHGKIIAVYDDMADIVDGYDHEIKTGIPTDGLFKTQAHAVNVLCAKNAERVAEYEAEMPDVKSLVLFSANHAICTPIGEDTDWEARLALRNRALALLGIEID